MTTKINQNRFLTAFTLLIALALLFCPAFASAESNVSVENIPTENGSVDTGLTDIGTFSSTDFENSSFGNTPESSSSTESSISETSGSSDFAFTETDHIETSCSSVENLDYTAADSDSGSNPEAFGNSDESCSPDTGEPVPFDGSGENIGDGKTEGGNSYTATVAPEDGKMVEADVATDFTVTFTELGYTDKLGSAQLTIPDSLTDLSFDVNSVVVKYPDGVVDADKSAKWSGNLVDQVLSLWADNSDDNNYLEKDWSVSAIFRAIASNLQTHHFDTEAWADANVAPGEGEAYNTEDLTHNNYYGYESDSDTYEEPYSQPKVNVWVDQAERDHRVNGDNVTVGLDDVRDNMNWHYVQTENIDLDVAPFNEVEGWEPIGSWSAPFIGSFDGNGNEIGNLYINNDPDGWDMGLFGCTGRSSILTNISIKDADIMVGGMVGALVGSNQGNIVNCHAEGEINITDESTPWAVGGLIGFNVGGAITDSSADVDITVGSSVSPVSNASSIGGLIGANGDGCVIGGIITDSHASGDITIFATGDVEYVGGLVGFNREADITGSFANGSITINTADGKVEYVGGLIGGNGNFRFDGDFLGGNISNSHYETGTISVSAGGHALYVAGLAGYSKDSDITGSHVGSTASPVMITVKSDDDLWGVGGLAGEHESGVVVNSHASVQIMVEGVRTDVVNAKSYEGIGGLIGSGIVAEINNSSAEGSIDVGRFGNRVGFADMIGGLAGFITESNIENSSAYVTIKGDLNNKAELIGGLIGLNEQCDITGSSAHGDIEIATLSGNVEYIGGLIGANGYKFGTYEYYGGNISDSYATGNITIYTAAGKISYVGGLVGVNGDYNSELGGNITNSYYETGKLKINAASDEVWNVGGLAGYSSGGDLTHSYAGNAGNPIEISIYASGGMWGIGGLIGGFDHGSITGSEAFAVIKVEGDNLSDYEGIGGLIGSGDYAEISDSSAKGKITVGTDSNRVGSATQVGGLAGSNVTVGIEGSTADVEIDIYAVDDVQWIGGMAGYSDDGDIIGNSASGDITIDSSGSVSLVGGLVGWNSGTISNSYATGNVIGTDYDAGGLVGDNRGTINDSYATGNVSGNECIGGLVGDNRGTINDSYATGNVSGYECIGGLVGFNNTGMISNSYATGNVIGTDYDAGGLVGYNTGTVTDSYATGSVSGNECVGGLVGWNDGTVSNSFYDQNTSGQSDTGKGEPKTTAEMKTLALYEDAGWSILPYNAFDPANPQAATWYIKEGVDYPILWWHHSGYSEAISPVLTMGWFDLTFPFELLVPEELHPIFDRVVALLESIASANMIRNGGYAELESARSVYALALQLYEGGKETLTDSQQAVIETWLALAEMAMLALEAALLDATGEAFDLAALQEALAKAQGLFEQNSSLLTAGQIAAAEALFVTVQSLISSLSS